MSFFFEAFLLGVSSGPLCFAYCTPVLLPFVAAQEKYKLSRTSILLGMFLLGRLTGYIAVGLVTGIVGKAVFEYGKGSLAAVVTILTGITLLVFGFLKNFREAKLCRRWSNSNSSTVWALTLGILTGLNICPPFLAAAAGSVTLGTIQGSLFYFTAFFIGTALYILPVIIFGPLSKIEPVRNIAKICLILVGLWFLFKGIMIWLR